MIFCVCEDDPHQLNFLVSMLKRVAPGEDHVFLPFDTPQKLIRHTLLHHVDVILMDIHLGKENGIELVNRIHETQRNVPVIFVTGNQRYRTDVYDAAHVFYLEKPVQESALSKAVQKAVKAAELRNRELETKSLIVRTRDSHTVVAFHEIMYMESDKRKLKIFCREDILPRESSESADDPAKTPGKMLVMYATIQDIADKLDNRFNHCHKSYVVNMDYIRRLDSKSGAFVLKNDDKVPISKLRKRQAIDKFYEYLSFKSALILLDDQ